MRLLVALGTALGTSGSTLAQNAGPDTVDLLRVKEAFLLSAAVQDSVWPDGWGGTPFPLLLVTREREFLVGYPRKPPGFTDGGYSRLLQTSILERPRQLQPNLVAAFPAFGPPSVIVVGRAEATGKTSTTWVLSVVHEHFHQFQTGDSSYYGAVEQLGLSGGDQSGRWMLDYPFPYRSAVVAKRFSALSRELGRLLERSSPADRRAFWQRYVQFLQGLSERDCRYLSFQVWQEGVARYVELRAAEVAARVYAPTSRFRVLPDFQPFPAVAAEMRRAMLDELANPDLPQRQRVSFYALGAGLALLLDKDVPGWKSRYLSDKFFLEGYVQSAE